MGHVGTLDPGADGVLPVLLGKATSLQDYLLEAPKAYSFTVIFGYETDSLDADGLVVRHAPFAQITREHLLQAVAACGGEQLQVPPAYSAVKFRGQPLYKLARQGKASAALCRDLSRTVQIYSLELEEFTLGRARFSLRCSKGTYVRVIARELAAYVGSCATVVELRRTCSSGISLSQCFALSCIEAALQSGSFDAERFIHPIEKLSLGLITLQAADHRASQRLLGGQELSYCHENFVGIDGKNSDNNCQALPAANETILLLRESGTALGLGVVLRRHADGCTVRMKRSLGYEQQ